MGDNQKSRESWIVRSARLKTQVSGQRAEKLAANYLVTQGVKILAHNIRGKGGEIDLIGQHQHHIIFVEVRLRHATLFGSAAESITQKKRHRIQNTAQYWLHTQGRAYSHYPCRFDAILFSSLAPPSLEWIQAAFDTC